MTSIPPNIAANIAQNQQNFAVSAIRNNAETSEQIANLVSEGANNINVLANSSRGGNVDITV